MKRIFRAGWFLAAALLMQTVVFAGVTGGFGGPSMGVVYNEMTDLNQKLKDAGYPAMDLYQFTVGGGGGAFFNNFYMGGRGFGYPGTQADNGKNIINISGGGGFFETGYAVLGFENFIMAPIVGIGGNEIQMGLASSSVSNQDFTQVLKNPGTVSMIEASSLSLEASLMTVVNMGFANLTVNTGYIYSFSPKWSLQGIGENKASLINNPVMNEHSFFVTVGMYFGGFSTDGKWKHSYWDYSDNFDGDFNRIDNQIEKSDTNTNQTGKTNITNDTQKQARDVLKGMTNQ